MCRFGPQYPYDARGAASNFQTRTIVLLPAQILHTSRYIPVAQEAHVWLREARFILLLKVAAPATCSFRNKFGARKRHLNRACFFFFFLFPKSPQPRRAGARDPYLMTWFLRKCSLDISTHIPAMQAHSTREIQSGQQRVNNPLQKAFLRPDGTGYAIEIFFFRGGRHRLPQ